MKKILAIISMFIICTNMYSQTVVSCPTCYGYGTVMTNAGPMYCPTCGGSGKVIVTQSQSSQPIFMRGEQVEYIRDVKLYQYNPYKSKYELYATYKMYKKSNNKLYVEMGGTWCTVFNATYPNSSYFDYTITAVGGYSYYFN
jgi:DnaJ-class molecular chaperone